MAIGRISGPLLKQNLVREGTDLAFETDLLYLDVNNSRIGINNSAPQHALDVSGTTKSTLLEAVTSANIGDISISGNSITSASSEIILGSDDNVFYQNKILVDDLEIFDNEIRSSATNANLELKPNGTGSVEVYSDLNVTGNIFASGNIRADGNITIGDSDTDNITINAEVTSNIIPDEDNVYTLGSEEKQWANVWVQNFQGGVVSAGSLEVDGIDLTLRQGNIFYVAENGSDANTGTHQNDPVQTIKQALSLASAGDTVHIYPGLYTEEFPLTVPKGVTVKGESIRGVSIQPTVATQDKDAFLINGEVTILDLTVLDFYYNSTDNTGYAFRFAPGMFVETRSPYIKNISVITKGSVTSPSDPRGFDAGDAGRGAYLDGAVVASNSREAGCLFHSVTFITPGVDGLYFTNGVRVEWLNSFTYFANRGITAENGTSGLYGAGRTALRVDDVTGTPVVGDTFSYYDTDGVTVIAQGTVDEIDGTGKIFLTGNVDGITEADELPGKTVNANGDAQLSTSEKQFGSSSLVLNETGDFLGIASSNDFGFGTGDFTIESFVYADALSATRLLLDYRAGTSTDNGILLFIGSGQPGVFINGSTVLQSSTTLATGQWYHIAVSRSGNTMKLFVDGVEKDSATISTDLGTTKPLAIGSRYDGSGGNWQGYIDEVRISKGVARYTGNFGVPTQEFSRDTDTVLLLHFNGTDGSTVIQDDGILAQDLRFIGSGASANYVTLADYTDFGGELRSIASACVYGNYGAWGDGSGVIMYLISQNFAYIGNGKKVDNDATTVIQSNEVIELNDARMRFSSVDHKGDFRVGDLFSVNQETGTVNFTSAAINVESTTGFTFSDGANTTIIDSTKVQTGNLKLSGNTLESISGDINIDSASDVIRFVDDVEIQGNLDVEGNVTIGGNITIGNDPADDITILAGIKSDLVPSETSTFTLGTPSKTWQTVYSNRAEIDDILVQNNFITTAVSNADLEIRSNGAGKIVLDDIQFSDNQIFSNLDIVLSSATDIVNVNTTGALNLPRGTTAERPDTPELGQIRYNTTTDLFEGYNGDWQVINGVYDLDLDTRITGELTPGANDNTIRFYVEDTVIATLTDFGLNTNRVEVDDIVIDGNVIEATPSDTDLVLSANGTGLVQFENIGFIENTITNTVPNSPTIIRNTGQGYFKVEGTGGFVFPVGTSINRPQPEFTETGMTRFNTDDRRLEVYDGNGWESVAGATGSISQIDAEFLAIEVALMVG